MKRRPTMHDVSVQEPAVEPGSQRSVFRRVSIYLPLIAVFCTLAPMIVYVMFMKELGWAVPVFGIDGATRYVAQSSDRVILYASSSSKTYFAGLGGNYEVLLAPWRNYLQSRKVDFREIQNASQLRKEQSGVLILPSAVALGDDERVEILAFRAKGGAILCSWATGTRDGNGGWRGWQFLQNLGARVIGEIPAAASVNNLILTGESPVSHRQGAGQRITLTNTSEALLRATGEVVAGRFMNPSRVIDEERRREGAVIFTETRESYGRVAYFAFAESGWEAQTLGAHDLISDTLQWLRREPAIIQGAWPNGKRAAQVIAMDTEEGFANAAAFASLMKSIDYRSTFYVTTSVGKLFPQVLAPLARDFELGYLGDTYASFKGQAPAVQEQRLRAMQSELSSVLPEPKGITGFRAPSEGYDSATETLLPKIGIRYHAAGPQSSSARLPLLVKTEGVKSTDSLVVLPRTQRSDINLYQEKLTAEQTTKALIDDFDLALDTGSLGLLSVHSRNFATDSVMAAAMPGFLAHLKERRALVWLASAGQVADWWRERERFKLTPRITGKRIEFDITITGQQPFNGATVIVTTPQRGVQTTVVGATVTVVKPTVSKIDDYRAALVFESLAPGNHSYLVTFSPK